MSEDEIRDLDPKPLTGGNLDAELQRELDEALGDMSIEQLLAAEEKPVVRPADGSKTRRGTVAGITGDDIFVDLGSRSQGVLSTEQFKDEPLPNIGDPVSVTIEGYDSANGLLLLSREGAIMEAAWGTLAEGQILEGRVTGHNKGGLEISINGIRAFMPISQVELFRVEDLAQYVDQKLRCQVTEVDQAEQNVIVSRRAILELEAQEVREKTFASLVEGKTIRGRVKTIMPYGAFVDVGGFDGLLHVKDMAYSRVEDPHSVVQEGQQIEVMVLKVDREARKIALGLKQVLPDPWQGAENKWVADTVISGRVTRLADFGAFVELEEGVDGLIPISELTYERRIKHPSEIVNPGDVVRVRVMSVDLERKRISLSLKRAGADPWVGASARWPAGTVVAGVVKRVTDFGAFVELTPGVEGLVHISELSGEHVRAVGDVVREGQPVQAKVISVDEDKRRVSLSIKQASAAVAEIAAAEAPDAPAVAPKKRKKPLKGGLD